MPLHLLALWLMLAPTAAVQDRPLPDFDTFATEVRKRLAIDQQRQDGWVFTERRREQKVNADGKVTDESVKVFEVYPGLPGEDSYRRLIEENGRAVTPEALAKTDRDRQKHVEDYARAQMRPSERQKAAREQEKTRREVAAAVDDLFRIYDITMVRREVLDGRDTILATLTPRPGVKPLTDDGKIMRHFKARAWISEADYELARVEIEAIDTLSFGLGMLARVHKGTVATFERRKVNGEAWLPAAVTWTASARVLLVRRLRLRGVSEFSDYRRFSVDTSTAIETPR